MAHRRVRPVRGCAAAVSAAAPTTRTGAIVELQARPVARPRVIQSQPAKRRTEAALRPAKFSVWLRQFGHRSWRCRGGCRP
jgi:hypothetical protein